MGAYSKGLFYLLSQALPLLPQEQLTKIYHPLGHDNLVPVNEGLP